MRCVISSYTNKRRYGDNMQQVVRTVESGSEGYAAPGPGSISGAQAQKISIFSKKLVVIRLIRVMTDM